MDKCTFGELNPKLVSFLQIIKKMLRHVIPITTLIAVGFRFVQLERNFVHLYHLLQIYTNFRLVLVDSGARHKVLNNTLIKRFQLK